MKRKVVAVLLVSAMAVSLAACGSKEQTSENSTASVSESKEETKEETAAETSEDTTEAKDEIKIYIGGGIFDSSLDPVKGAMSYGYNFINEGLLQVNPDSEYVASLATDWSVSEDALTYTFTLAEGVKFSDGSDFTAEDVVFTYEQVMKNQANNENVDLTKLKEVKAIDDYTVEFTLSEPYSPFLDNTAMLHIVPSDSYDSDSFDQMPIGTGAYKVVQYDALQQIILEKNEYYYEAEPAISKVTIVKMEQEAAFAAAQAGTLDVVMIGANYATEEIEGMKVERCETMDVRNVSMPLSEVHKEKAQDGTEMTVGNDVTSDKAVREALSIGLNRQEIINNAFNGVGKPAVNFTDNLVWASTDDYDDSRTEEAIKLLEDAGWVDSDGDGIREKDDLKCSFQLIAPGGDQDRYNLAVAMSANAVELGIEIEVITATWDEVVTMEYTTPVLWGWGQYSPTVLQSLFSSEKFLNGGYDNVVGMKNDKIDEKINEALSANNQADAIVAWKDVQTLADAEYSNLYLVNIEHCYFVSEDLDISMDTQVPHPHGHGSPIINNLEDWTLS